LSVVTVVVGADVVSVVSAATKGGIIHHNTKQPIKILIGNLITETSIAQQSAQADKKYPTIPLLLSMTEKYVSWIV
jgi:hypothetical protein